MNHLIGEKPYACAVCPRAFNQRVVLREHVRSHHSAPDRRANGYYCFICLFFYLHAISCSRVSGETCVRTLCVPFGVGITQRNLII